MWVEGTLRWHSRLVRVMRRIVVRDSAAEGSNGTQVEEVLGGVWFRVEHRDHRGRMLWRVLES